MYARHATSDLEVFDQIFIKKEYSPLDDMKDPKVIVDCGAYVGYSTTYFLTKFQHARVVAIEADPDNFQLSKKNLSAYGNRVTLLHSAVWHRRGRLVAVRGTYRDGREWATQVRECLPGEAADVAGTDLLGLMERMGLHEVDLLKIDIEGAERVLFKEGGEPWLERVRNIAIELHDNESETIFFKALSHYRYDLCRFRELTICRDLTPKTM